MSEPEKPKRRSLYQLHLSTAVLLTIVVATFLGLTLRCEVAPDREHLQERFYLYGWPFKAFVTPHRLLSEDEYFQSFYSLFKYANRRWFLWSTLLDVLCVMSLLLATAVVSEWLIRRRKGRNP